MPSCVRSLAPELRLHVLDQVVVLGVHHRHRAEPRALLEQRARRAVVEPDPGLGGREVGGEELEGRGAVRDCICDRGHRRVGRGAGEDGVEGEVGVRARVEDPAAVLDRDVGVELLLLDVDVHERERDDRRRAAEERGARRALRRLQPLLAPLRPAPVHRLVNVRVRLDTAGEDELAARIDHAARVRLDRPRRSDVGDRLAGDPDLELAFLEGRDDVAAA